MGICGCEAMCCWGLRTPGAYLYWGMARTGAAPAAEALAGRWPRAWVAGDRKETLLRKLVAHSDWLQAVEKYSMTFLVSMCHQTSSILLALLGNNFAVLRYYIAWRKNYVYVFNKCYVTVFIWRNLTM